MRTASFIFYWHKALRAEKRKPLVKIIENLSFMLAQHLTAVKDVIFFWPITSPRIFNPSYHMTRRAIKNILDGQKLMAWKWVSQWSWPEAFFSLSSALQSPLCVMHILTIFVEHRIMAHVPIMTTPMKSPKLLYPMILFSVTTIMFPWVSRNIFSKL